MNQLVVLNEIVRDAPAFHGHGTASWALEPDALSYISTKLGPSSKSLETGAGMSTVVFALAGCSHICITPSSDEVQRIKAYCRSKSIAVDNVKFIVGPSERVLPSLRLEGFDLALVDGSHRFPVPFLDWYYMTPRMKLGGVVVIDDVQLWTGELLRDFLLEETEWRQITHFDRSCAFLKLAEYSGDKDWTDQPFVVREGGASYRRYHRRHYLSAAAASLPRHPITALRHLRRSIFRAYPRSAKTPRNSSEELLPGAS